MTQPQCHSRRTRAAAFALASAFALGAAPALGEAPGTATYTLAPDRAMSPTAALRKLPADAPPPKIDGRITDPAWEHAVQLGPLTQQTPHEGAEPTFQTEVKVLYDDEFLYVAVRAWDPEPDKLIRKVMRRDTSQRSDDRVLLAVDTFHDKRNGYMFSTNPNSARYEALIENNQTVRAEWDGIWYARARVDAKGWTCEFALPYQTLAFDPAQTTWGFNVIRSVRRINEESRWASWRQSKHPLDMSEAGTLTGIEGVVPGIGLDLVPSGAVGGFREREVDPVTGDVSHGTWATVDPSLDAFYKITPSVTGALTFNTDFSDADVDARQVNLDRFALFFPETRDFFLQDAGIFDFGGIGEQTGFNEISNPNAMPFFTRKLGIFSDPAIIAPAEILDIRAGAKATGRVGRLNFGVLDVQLEDFQYWCEPGYPLDLNADCGQARTSARTQQIDIGSKNLSVARAKWNVGAESTVGAIATHGDPNSPGSGTTFGTDFRLRTSQFAGSNIAELIGFAQHTHTPGVSGDDDSYGLRFRYPNDLWFADFSWAHVGEEFDPKLGFVNRDGVEQVHFEGRKRWRPVEGRVRFYDSWLKATLVQGTDGHLETLIVNPTLIEVHNHLDDFFYVGVESRSEIIEDLDPRLDNCDGFIIDERSGLCIAAGRYDWARAQVGIGMAQSRPAALFLDYSVGGFFGGHLHSIEANLELRLSKHFFGQLEYIENKADLPDSFGGNDGDFTQRLVRVRAQFIFTPDLSWDTFVQYDNVTETVGLNSRLRWIIRPGEELTLVWNQGADATGDYLRGTSTGLTSKLAWTFRF